MNRIAVMVGLCLFGAGAVADTDLYMYPNAGQSEEQQRQDRYECHSWAVQQTGFDPTTATPPASGGAQVVHSGPPRDDGLNPVTGAAGGAAMGAVGGAIAGDAGRGAAIGAGVGAVAGFLHLLTRDMEERDRARHRAVQQAHAQAQAGADYDARRADYLRAVTACMEGRQYTVR